MTPSMLIWLERFSVRRPTRGGPSGKYDPFSACTAALAVRSWFCQG
jgi:hypothetical protein